MPRFKGLKLCSDPMVKDQPWGVHQIIVMKPLDQILVSQFGHIGWGGNSGFGALNLAVQFGLQKLILVGFDMRLDKGVHWHGPHKEPLHNPTIHNVLRWRRVIEENAGVLARMGIEIINASEISALQSFPKLSFDDAVRHFMRQKEAA